MLLTHTKPRPDLNGPQPQAPKRTALQVMQALRMATGLSPIKTARNALPR